MSTKLMQDVLDFSIASATFSRVAYDFREKDSPFAVFFVGGLPEKSSRCVPNDS